MLIFFWKINAFPLRSWDEAWYGEIIRNMAQGTHGWLVPFWNGEYYFDKPPLYFWLTLPFFKIFGVGEWQTRIVSVLAAIGATFLVYLLGKKLFSGRAGLFSAVVFLSLGQVAGRFSEGNLDALLVFLFLLTFYFFLLGSEKKIFIIFSGITLGLGFLVKGWLLGLFPFLLIFFYSLISQRKIQFQRLLLLLFISFLSSGWWFFLGYQNFGQRFLDWYLLSPTAGTFARQFHFSSQISTTFFRDIGFWWLAFVLLLLTRKIVLFKKEVLISFLAAIFVFVLAVHFLDSFIGWYLLPVYPLMALIIGCCLDSLSRVHFKLAIGFGLVMLLMQGLLLGKLQNLNQDRSFLMADLGITAKEVVPREETLVLDDPDFTSFLFYSQHQKIYTLSDSGGKAGEWWIIKKEDLPDFIKGHSPVWVISQDLKNLPVNFNDNQVVATQDGFRFLRL